MLLTEWQRQVGLPARSAGRSSLEQIERFEFGETYVIRTKTGVGYSDSCLEKVLGIMVDEFRAHSSAVLSRDRRARGMFPRIGIQATTGDARPTRSDPLGLRGPVSRMLIVIPTRGWRFKSYPPAIEDIDAAVRLAVTTYSLTGNWDHYKGYEP